MAFEPFDPELAALRRRRQTLALSLVGLALFLAWQALALRSFIRTETRPPSWDQSVHMEIALDYRRALESGSEGSILNLAPKPGMPAFPPLYHLAIKGAYDSDNPAAAALWVNWIYLAILCFSIFGIVYHFRADLAALGAAVAFASCPAVQQLYLTQMIDLSVVALSAAAIFLYLLSEDFQHWAASIGFGLLFGIGMLHKWSFFSYMVPAYWGTIKALSRNKDRLPALAAWTIAIGLCAPWYIAQGPHLFPRLLHAASTFSVPRWKGGEIVSYLFESAEGLGPLFWILSWLGLLVPQYRRNVERGWSIPIWVVSSYIFWSLLPARQLRLLLPGLPGLAASLGNAWPIGIVWAAAVVNMFGAANNINGWISPIAIPMPVRSAVLFPSDPPASVDWRVDEILKEAERRADPAEPVANMSLVGNDYRFNIPLFNWRAKALDLEKVRMREVDERLSELSQFVLFKTGSLGPPGMTANLPEAAAAIKKTDGWFSRGYERVGQYVLPDGGEAWLFGLRKPKEAPFKAKGLTKFQYYQTGPFSATDFKVDIGAWDTERGVYRKVTATAPAVELRGLRLIDVALELRDVLIIPGGRPTKEFEFDEVRFLKLGTLKLHSISLPAEAIKEYAKSRIKGLEISSLTLDGSAKLEGSLRGVLIKIELVPRVVASPSAIALDVKKLSIGPSNIPLAWLGPWKEITVPLEPNSETPFRVEIPGLTLKNDRLTVP